MRIRILVKLSHHKKLTFYMKNTLYVFNRPLNIPTKVQKPYWKSGVQSFCLLILAHFLAPGSRSIFLIRIRIQESQINADPEPTTLYKKSDVTSYSHTCWPRGRWPPSHPRGPSCCRRGGWVWRGWPGCARPSASWPGCWRTPVSSRHTPAARLPHHTHVHRTQAQTCICSIYCRVKAGFF